MRQYLLFFFLLSSVYSFARQVVVNNDSSEAPLAFPSAEGFGKWTTGGRTGKTIIVTNLNDTGKGSFREAAVAKFPRIIVFAVSGTIHLNSPLSIKGNTTIAGQTAPGDGVCLADAPVTLGGNNIIVRYLRFRMGDKNQKGGMVNKNGSDDAFGGSGKSNIIIDHCTMSWSTDEAFSVYGGDSTTLQWNLISEPLNYSYHFEEGDTDYEHHGYGAIWGGHHTSAHHNLFAHCVNRTPRFNGARTHGSEFVDFRNNVIYNWQINNTYAGEGGEYNIIGNYYRPGPNTEKKGYNRILTPYKKLPKLDYGKFYLLGNTSEAATDVTTDNWKGVVMDQGTEEDISKAKALTSFATEMVATQSAQEAYKLVLNKAGASFHRDTLDQRIINNVVTRTGRIIDVQGGYPHGTSYEETITAWPELKTEVGPADSDSDGMPDEWEQKHGLNPNNPEDGSTLKLHSYCTNIEVYINSIVQ